MKNLHNKIMQKALEKAISNGFERKGMFDPGFKVRVENTFYNRKQLWIENEDDTTVVASLSDILFSHEFAKALWGEEFNNFRIGEVYYTNDNPYKYSDDDNAGINPVRCAKVTQESWKYHLQQMILEEDPIKYLEKFI
jgi:hypothetical protein